MGRDHDALADVRIRLIGNNLIPPECVLLHSMEELESAADRNPIVLIEPDEWEEIDDVDEIQIVRRVKFKLTILVRDHDPERRNRKLDLLESSIANLIAGKSLGGFTLPAFTCLRKGKYQKPQPPERALVVLGEFAYFVEGYGGRDETNNSDD